MICERDMVIFMMNKRRNDFRDKYKHMMISMMIKRRDDLLDE